MFPHKQKQWLVLYKAALLESDLQKMPSRIVLAGRALQRRLQKLQGCGGHYGERLEIEYAIRNLKAAERMSDDEALRVKGAGDIYSWSTMSSSEL